MATSFVLAMAAGQADHSTGADHGSGLAVSIATHQESEVSAGKMDVEKELAAFRVELLELAFQTASAIPIEPHIKDRSRMQEVVAAASLQLDQPLLALRFADQIADWRRGAAYADAAMYAVKNGISREAVNVENYLEQARKISEGEEDWRRDSIRAKISGTYLLLGETEKARLAEDGLVDSEAGKADVTRADQLDDGDFDPFVTRLDAVIATHNFDLTRNALDAYVRLFDRFHENLERRTAIERKLKESALRMPIIIRIDLMLGMSKISMSHGERENALALVNEAHALMDTFGWQMEDQIPLMARLAHARHDAGDFERARAEAHATLEAYLAGSSRIISVFRAAAIRPLAEAYHAMNDDKASLDVYRIALEDGAANLNARPRAEDLAATCVSMAICGLEPDESFWTRIRELHAGLDHPW